MEQYSARVRYIQNLHRNKVNMNDFGRALLLITPPSMLTARHSLGVAV